MPRTVNVLRFLFKKKLRLQTYVLLEFYFSKSSDVQDTLSHETEMSPRSYKKTSRNHLETETFKTENTSLGIWSEHCK